MNDIFKTLSSTTVDDIADYAIGETSEFRKHAGLELLLSIWKRERLEAAVNSNWYKELGNESLEIKPVKFEKADKLTSDTFWAGEKPRVRANEIALGKKYYIYNDISEQVCTMTEVCTITKIAYQKCRYWIKKGGGSFFINGYFISETPLDLNQYSVKLSLIEGLRKSKNIANRKIEVYSKNNHEYLGCYDSVKEAADSYSMVPANIYKVLNKRCDSHKGYIFRYSS